MAELELWQFQYSHFCEKARWVLDYKQIPHRRHSLLPGFHIRKARKASGQQLVPILFIDGQALADSSAITTRLEADHPEPSLMPGGELGQRALDWERRLGEELGPSIRRALFFDLLPQKEYALGVLSSGATDPEARRFRRAFWFLKLALKASMGLTRTKAAAAWARTESVLDQLADATANSDYLVGDSFTIADLTAVALLCPLLPPEWKVLCQPALPPPELRAVIDRYQAHPAIAWARRIWERHRPESAEIKSS